MTPDSDTAVDLDVPLAPELSGSHEASGEQVPTRDLSGLAPPARPARRWTPKRVVATPAALDHPHGQRIAARVEALGLEVDVLVNNAGFGTSGCFHESDVEREVQQVRILVEAVVDLTGRLLPGMVARGEGGVLVVASVAGFQPLPRMAGYGAAKAWARSFTAVVGQEVGRRGVSVTALCPGPVETEFFDVSGPTPIERVVPRLAWVEAADVARAGVDGLERGRAEVIPGAAMRATIAGARLVPLELRTPVFGRFFR